MPVKTAQSPEHLQSVQDANAAQPQQSASDSPETLGQYAAGMIQRRRAAFPFNDNLIAEFFIAQGELTNQQRARLVSAMSLRNIQLNICTSEMPKKHDIMISSAQPEHQTRIHRWRITFLSSSKENMKEKVLGEEGGKNKKNILGPQRSYAKRALETARPCAECEVC